MLLKWSHRMVAQEMQSPSLYWRPSMRFIKPFVLALMLVVAFSQALPRSTTFATSITRGQRTRPGVPESQRIPTPKDVIGFTPGDDRKLASWAQIVEYFKRLDQSSNKVKFEELGKTTLGRPF